MRVGPAPTAGTPGGNAVTPNSIGNAVGAPVPATYRLASVPAVSRLNAQFTGPPLATIRKPVQVTHSEYLFRQIDVFFYARVVKVYFFLFNFCCCFVLFFFYYLNLIFFFSSLFGMVKYSFVGKTI